VLSSLARRYFAVTGFYMLCERILFTIVLEDVRVLALLPHRSYMLKRMYERGYTRLMIFWMLSTTLNRPNSALLEYLYTVACIASFASLSSFHLILPVDPTAHHRLATHVGIPLPAFSVGNVVVHGLPCVLAVLCPPQAIEWHHGLAACAVQVFWGLCATGGTFLLDDIYSPADKGTWHGLWVVALITNVMMPWYYHWMEWV
jgi:hypothetical protein